jgi:hypothetical protein
MGHYLSAASRQPCVPLLSEDVALFSEDKGKFSAHKRAVATLQALRAQPDAGFDVGRLHSEYMERHHRQMRSRFGFEYWQDWHLPVLPFFIDAAHFRRIEEDIRIVVDAILSIPAEKFGGDLDAYAMFLGLPVELGYITRLQHAGPWRLNVARPDCYLTSTSAQIIEINLDSGIGGVPDCHTLVDYYRKSPVVDLVANESGEPVRFHDALENFARFLETLPAPVWYMESAQPRDDAVARAYHEFETRFIAGCVEGVRLAAPPDIEARCGALYLGAERLRSVFRGLSLYQFARRRAEFAHVIDAMIDDKSIQWESSPVSLLFENKMNLAILSDERHSPWLDADQRAAVRRCIPWTRRLDSSHIEKIAADQGRFVIKKCASHGGRDVWIGRETSDAEMMQAATVAARDGGWVVQRYVDPPIWDNFFWVSSTFIKSPVPFLTRVFVYQNKIRGLFANIYPKEQSSQGPFRTPGYRVLGGGAVAVVGEAREADTRPRPGV